MGTSFNLDVVPPTITRFHPLPDKSRGVLEQNVPVASVLIELNGMDTTKWTFEDLSGNLGKIGPVARVMTFRLPASHMQQLQAKEDHQAEEVS